MKNRYYDLSSGGHIDYVQGIFICIVCNKSCDTVWCYQNNVKGQHYHFCERCFSQNTLLHPCQRTEIENIKAIELLEK